MSTHGPRKTGGSSHDLRDASEELRLHMQIRMKVSRIIDMFDRHDQIRSSERELMSGILADLDKQGEKFMTRVEKAGGDVASSVPPPPPLAPPMLPAAPETPPETPTSKKQRMSMKPTVMVLEALNARTFERTIRTRYDEAKTEAERDVVISVLRRGIDNSPEYAADTRLQSLEAELRGSR